MRVADRVHCSKTVRNLCGLSGVVIALSALQVAWAADATPATPPPAAQPVAQSQPAGGPVLRCDQPVHDFGETWGGDKIEHTFSICNDGKLPLGITNVRPSCGCTVAGEFDKVIEPGKCGKIPLVLTLAKMTGPVTKLITVESTDTTKPNYSLTLKGSVKQRLAMEPVTGANWGRFGQQSPESMKVKITNNTGKPMKLEPIPAPPGATEVFQNKMDEIEPGKVFEVTITLKKPVPEGTHNMQLRYKTGVAEEPEVIIPCSLILPPELELIPGSIMGTVQPTSETVRMVMLNYNGAGKLNVSTITPSDPAIKTQLMEREPGRSYTLSITLPPGFATPDKEAELLISTGLEKRPQVRLPIRMHPVATQPSGVDSEALLSKPAPTGVLRSPEGQNVAIGAAGQITVIDFWASWCPHCKRQLPVLQKIKEDYIGKGVKFIAVSIDSQKTGQEIAQAAKDLAIDIPVAMDPTQALASRYGATTHLPSLFVLDKGGVIQALHVGNSPSLSAEIPAELNLLLQGKSRDQFPDFLKAASKTPSSQPSFPAPTLSGPKLTVDPVRQDVGQRKPGEKVHTIVNYRNLGNQPAELAKVTLGEGLKLSQDYPKTLPSGATGVLSLEFTVSDKPGPFSYDMMVDSNDKERPAQKVTITGTVRQYVEVQPVSGINFPRNPRAQSVPSMATLVYNGQGSVEYGKPTSSSPKFEATVEPIPNGPFAKLIVKAKPPFTPGENIATLTITTNCKQQPKLEVPVRLFLPPRIEVNPAELTISALDRPQRNLISITNNGDKPMNILGVKANTDRLRPQFYPDNDGLSYRMMITYTPPTTQPFDTPAEAKITIRTDDPEFGEIIVPVKFGTPPTPAGKSLSLGQ
jgi:thiol-disulfide isomerase/thioredoxin